MASSITRFKQSGFLLLRLVDCWFEGLLSHEGPKPMGGVPSVKGGELLLGSSESYGMYANSQ